MNQEGHDTYSTYKTAPPTGVVTANETSEFERATDRFILLGNSSAFSRMLLLIDKLAKVQAPVLIEGETGTGKEMAARAIHYRGTRRDQAFVPINCGALPENLIESELFGHVKGAFTDARADQPGLVETAAGGTLFLDEIDALTPRAQRALLRFLQDSTYRPIGARVERKVDVRIIAATNSSMDDLVQSHAFRSDLLYRLRILGMRLPPLREREDDAMLLANVFFNRCRLKFPCNARELDQESCDWFSRYSWPGNIRELEGLIFRETVVCDDTTLRLTSPVHYSSERRRTFERRLTGFLNTSYSSAKSAVLEQFERQYLTQLIARTRGNVSQAARLAGKERRAFGKLLKKHGINGCETPNT
ncbi:sigma 54-interacting transcriptional regulator [Nitrosovibrio sp. Nv6]|uniref:sigma 54-interacting transcriptional regulator n=1 Tax=Nitrosovibrio sp. Nv6 TaxID=1855340 RepID=UPI0008CA6068|nr:sigma-54 dependent transcriptional regulator [Nitrosovibrio sp. Nv6]SEO73759.1 DNA-binding transcriptional response regulator, NtrC family, contains REC, AAA-type ATPase, and a Fis-type DNA-binding domains [Nitrosovibrio sp. Nv6]